jgi:hypothetical protein
MTLDLLEVTDRIRIVRGMFKKAFQQHPQSRVPAASEEARRTLCGALNL